MATETFDASVGDRIGDYLIAHRIDEDENSLLFHALHQTLRHLVAVRIPRIRLLSERPELPGELLDYARMVAPLSHPHLVRLLDYRDTRPAPFFVFEFVRGLSLRQLIRQSGRLRWDRAIRLLTQMASALAGAWQAGLIHGRLWPGQILVTPEGSGKLILGIPALRRSLIQEDSRQAYQAPEQLSLAAPVDHQADIFALGAIGYEMLLGKRPFSGTDRSDPTPIHELTSEIPLPISQLIHRMIAFHASARIDSYAELLHELQSIRLPGWSAPD